MKLLTDNTATRLWCCAEAIQAALDRRQFLDEKGLRLCLKAMREAIDALKQKSVIE